MLNSLNIKSLAIPYSICFVSYSLSTFVYGQSDDVFDTDFLLGSSFESTDFGNSAYFVDGEYNLYVYVNGKYISYDRFAVKNNAVCIPYSIVVKLGLKDNLVKSLSAKDGDCIDLEKEFNGLVVDFEQSKLNLNIAIPQAYLQNNEANYVSPLQADNGINAVFIDYNLNGWSYKYDNGLEQNSQFLSLNSGINIGSWRLRHQGNFRRNEQKTDQKKTTDEAYTALNTYLQKDIPSLNSRLVIGESYTPSELFDSFEFTGVQLGTDNIMLPESQRGFAPTIQGIANTNAKVTIKQGNSIIYETTVAAGPFSISNLNNLSYEGDLDVIVTEANGEVRTSKVAFSSVPQLLRTGVSKYNVTLGQYRNSSLDNTPYFALGTYQRGLSNNITSYMGNIFSEDYYAVQLGLASSNRFGAFAFDITHSSATNLNPIHGMGTSSSGQSYRLSFNKRVKATDTNIAVAAYKFSSEGYLSFSDFVKSSAEFGGQNQIYREKNKIQLTVNQPLGQNLGSFFLSGVVQDYWNQEHGYTKSFQAGYSKGFKWGNVSLSASTSYNQNLENDTQYSFSVGFPLGKKTLKAPYISTSVTHSNHDFSSIQTNASGTLGENNKLSYGVFANQTKFNDESSFTSGFNAQYRADKANISANYTNSKEYDQFGYGLSGSVVLHRQGINFSQDQGETKVLVEVPKSQGVKVTNNNGGSIAKNGFGLVSSLQPYRNNIISLDTSDVPNNIMLDITAQTVAPNYGAIVVAKYPTKSGTSVIFKVNKIDGENLPLGANVYDSNHNIITQVGQGNKIFLMTEELDGSLTINYGQNGEKTCSIPFSLNKPNTDDYLVVETSCLESAH